MSAQDILFYAGVVALVLAAAFTALAVYTYRKEDIRAVRDDLSGKTRQRGIDAAGTKGAKMPSPSHRPVSPKVREVARGGLERARAGAAQGAAGDDGITGILAGEDGPTGVFAADDSPTGMFGQGVAPTDVLGRGESPTGALQVAGADVPTSVLEDADARTTVLVAGAAVEGGIDDVTTVLHPGFVVTRSDVRVHSETVIPIDWESA